MCIRDSTLIVVWALASLFDSGSTLRDSYGNQVAKPMAAAKACASRQQQPAIVNVFLLIKFCLREASKQAVYTFCERAGRVRTARGWVGIGIFPELGSVSVWRVDSCIGLASGLQSEIERVVQKKGVVCVTWQNLGWMNDGQVLGEY